MGEIAVALTNIDRGKVGYVGNVNNKKGSDAVTLSATTPPPKARRGEPQALSTAKTQAAPQWIGTDHWDPLTHN